MTKLSDALHSDSLLSSSCQNCLTISRCALETTHLNQSSKASRFSVELVHAEWGWTARGSFPSNLEEHKVCNCNSWNPKHEPWVRPPRLRTWQRMHGSHCAAPRQLCLQTEGKKNKSVPQVTRTDELPNTLNRELPEKLRVSAARSQPTWLVLRIHSSLPSLCIHRSQGWQVIGTCPNSSVAKILDTN